MNINELRSRIDSIVKSSTTYEYNGEDEIEVPDLDQIVERIVDFINTEITKQN